ncbi:MAG TPA: phosphoserine phosphatase SerB [Burkholderiales bacterium]|nr:phosphoserine phosphatase SerB [Burkholderiales bacterium]
MNLIIQGSEIQNRDLKHLAKLAGASRIEQIAGEAFRLCETQASSGVAEYCENAKLDFAFVPENIKLANFGLLAMDMDSTLITIECIDELADIRGIKAEVSRITASSVRGEIEFTDSVRRRVALLAGLNESALQKVYDERLQLSPGAEKMLAGLKAAGVKTLLITSGFTFFAERLKKRLNLDYTYSNSLEIVNSKLSGKLAGKIIDADAKAIKVEDIRKQLGLKKEQVIAIGDGANDLKMMAQAGVSIAYHAQPIVRRQTTYTIDHVGLEGVVNLFA